MKRHMVMDLFHGNKTEVVDGPWNCVENRLPDILSCKVKVKLNNESELMAYFYADKAQWLSTTPSFFWRCSDKEPLFNVTHWKYLKEVDPQ